MKTSRIDEVGVGDVIRRLRRLGNSWSRIAVEVEPLLGEPIDQSTIARWYSQDRRAAELADGRDLLRLGLRAVNELGDEHRLIAVAYRRALELLDR